MLKVVNIVGIIAVLLILLTSSHPKPFTKVLLSNPTPSEIFMQKIAQIESNGNHTVVNRYGMMGKYQFSPSTVKVLGFSVSKEEFLSNPYTQDSIMLEYMIRNERELAHLISRFDGRIFKGVRINRASVLAGAHFAGSGNMKKFLTDPEHSGISDGNGTTLIKYMSYFRDFNLPPIKI